jgi:hypothetical protein
MPARAVVRYALLATLLTLGVVPWAPRGVAQPAPQTFAGRIDRLSEPGGDFDTDNLISNERSFLEVSPALKAATPQRGVYIGVGPDQNFSYIALLRPSIAFIVDIRRDNLLLHLLFKALFAASRNRIEYLSLLTGRTPPERLDSWKDATLERIIEYVDAAAAEGPDALRRLDRRMHDAIAAFGVPLDGGDYATIQRFHHTFIAAGLSLKFESRGRPAQRVYPTYRDLLLATDRGGRTSSFVAAEGDFQFVKSLEAQDLLIPVVGDLGGTHALSAIADLMNARSERLSAFYISNVETYLGGKYAQFVKNVGRLPHDGQSVLIRSIFRNSVSSSEIQPVNEFVAAGR